MGETDDGASTMGIRKRLFFNLDDKKSDIDGVLHEAGPKGWELVGIATMTKEVIFVFKRPAGWG